MRRMPNAYGRDLDLNLLRVFAVVAEAGSVRLLGVLEREAPRMRVVAVRVQFRTIGAALAAGLDTAVTVADELPSTICRQPLFTDTFTCLHDPRHARLRTLSEKEYFARPARSVGA